jgi:hypothetical protein
MSKARRLRTTFSYANVVSTLCLFLLLGGGMALAATQLGKNTVGSKQLKKSAVTAAKIKANAVTGAKVKDGSLTGADLQDGSIGGGKLQDGSVAGSKLTDNSVGGSKLQDGSVTGAKVQDGSLTGADINQSTLTSVRASNVTGMGFNGDSTCSAATALPPGVSSERIGGPGSGECLITFPSSVIDCAATVSTHVRATGLVIVVRRAAEIIQFTNTPNKLEIDTYAESSAVNEPFDLTLVC